MISTPVKFPIRNFIPDQSNVPLTIEGNIWYINDFLKTVGNNIILILNFY